MPYELRAGNRPPERFDREDDAIKAAKALLLAEPDAEVDIRDTATGQPIAPGASQHWREELKSRIGF